MVEFTPIRNLKPGLKDLHLMCIVLDIGRPNVTKEGHEVRTVKIADKTGSVNLSLWDEPGKLIASGDIVRISKGYISLWKNCLTLYIGKGGELVKVGEFCLAFSEIPFMSEPNPELAAIQAQIQADRNSTGPVNTGKMYSNNNNRNNNGSTSSNSDPRSRSGNGYRGGNSSSSSRPSSQAARNLKDKSRT